MDYPMTTLDINQLLYAVREDKVKKVKMLLSKVGKNDHASRKAYIEAHLLCRYDIIKIMEPAQHFDRERTIRILLNEYDQRIERIFDAIQKGIYRKGVAQMLQHYELATSIKDTNGRSLLHAIASAKDHFGGPKWSVLELKDFLQNNSCSVNATDFEGKTCLHHLAEAADSSRHRVHPGTRKTSNEDAWIKMATILIEFGCDASLKDFARRFPFEFANTKRTFRLQSLLMKGCELHNADADVANSNNLMKVASYNHVTNFTSNENIMNVASYDNHNKVASYDNLNKVTSYDNLSKVQSYDNHMKIAGKDDAYLTEILNCHQNISESQATGEYISVSATQGQLAAVTLLVLSGKSNEIGGRSTFPSAEADHKENENPSPLYYAVARRECINRLRFETTRHNHETAFENLQINNHINDVEKGIFDSMSDEYLKVVV